MRRSPYIKTRRASRRRCLIGDFSHGLNSATDESALPFNAASDYKNFRLESGVLTDGWGTEPFPPLANVQNAVSAWEYVRTEEGEKISVPMYCDADGFVHAVKDGNDETLDGIKFTSAPIAVNYRLYGGDVSLICSATDGMAVYDGESAYKVDPSPLITGMTLHYERLFATTANESDSVRFSDDLDPTNWAEGLDSGGFVQLADGYGRCNKTVGFLNYVYIFRDYGISRMVAYADQTRFSVSNLYVSSGRIFSGSVTVCGDRIIFLASDGLYVFDGLETRRLLPQLGELTKFKDSAVGKYFDGKYFLAYSSGGDKNDSLLVYDLASGMCELSSGFEITSFYQGDALAAVSGGKAVVIAPCGAALSVPTHKVWRVPLGALSAPDKIKCLRTVDLETATDLTMKVFADGKTRKIRLRGKNGIQHVGLGVRGRKIGLELSSDGVGTKISSFSFTVSD